MKNPLTSFKKQYLALVLVIILIVGILAFELSPKQYYLTISSSPETAAIYINDQYVGVGSAQKRYTEGEYRVRAELEGYKTEEKTIGLNDTTQYTLVLSPTTKTEPITTTQNDSLSTAVVVNSQNSLLIGLNRLDSILYLYSEAGATALHSKPIETFSYEHPYIIALEKQNTQNFIIINVDTLEKRAVQLRTLEPLVAANIVPYANEVFFLARLDASARTTTLFKSEMSFLSPTEISKTKATDVAALSSSKVLLFEQADGLDLSRVVVYDTTTKTELLRVAANAYTISPNKQYVFIKDSTQVVLYDVAANTTVRLPKTGSYFPFFSVESTPIILTNTAPGVSVSYLSPTNLSTTKTSVVPELATNSVRWVAGVQTDLLVVADINNKLWQIKLP